MLYRNLKIPEEIKKATEELGYEKLTEIQEKAIYPMLEGRDIIARAPTGTGKTAAFGIPLLVKIDPNSNKTQAVILAPTRELARQITQDLTDYSKYLNNVRVTCIYGGEPIQKQTQRLKKPPHIIVATPGRLIDHMKRQNISLNDAEYVILDEADEMLDMGFYKDVRYIVDRIKNKKQMGMFSATISREVMDISWLYQRKALEITVKPVKGSKPKIAQYAILTTGHNKLPDVAQIIVDFDYDKVMIFCNTIYTTNMLATQMRELNFNVDCLHGDLSQKDRNRIMRNFKQGKTKVLVSTDVAARGIDVDDVDAVINYDLPDSNEYYTHRIGRTGRAKRKGAAYILYLEEEASRLEEMLRLTKNKATQMHFNKDLELVEGMAK